MKRLSGLFAVLFALLAALFAILLATAWLLPASVWGAAFLPPSVTVVEGSTLVAGRGVANGREGTGQFEWRWCPARGVLAFCTQFAAGGGHGSAVVTPRMGRVVVRALEVSRYPATFLGVGTGVFEGRLDGGVQRLSIPTLSACVVRDMEIGGAQFRVSALRLMGRSLSDHRLEVVPGQGQPAPALLRIAGPEVNGDLAVTPAGALAGTLAMADAGGAVTRQAMEINLPLHCGRVE